MTTKKFFDERSDQSEVKARIVQKYFAVWSNVILPTAARRNGRIAYIDLYAGPGRYKDGAASTPLLILEHAIRNPKLAKSLVVYLNDSDENNSGTLRKEIENLPGIETLAHKPIVYCEEIDGTAERYFNETKLDPSFTFIDPFGYKGLSAKILKGVIKDWGCDCVFFFNYNRINAGLPNDAVAEHMDALFGSKARTDRLRDRLAGLSSTMREALILEELAQELKQLGGTYVLPFTFKNSKGTRTSHKLIFVSKHFKGYSIMKDIMAKESSTEDQGVPSFTYSPADASMPLLFSLFNPLHDLRSDLMKTYAGKSMSVENIYKDHSVGQRYILKNYKDVLIKLEEESRITVTGNRRKGSFPDHLIVNFPSEIENGN